jgi:4-amino-4-deoxy-L-arabinose transferase-like glycosyltransferase
MSQTTTVPDQDSALHNWAWCRLANFGLPISVKPTATQRAILLVVGLLLFLVGLGDRDLNSSHEARAAQNAQMVLSEGDWLLPRLFDGHLELQKPPLYYWLVALFAWAGGGEVGPWAVRLPAALSALGCVLFLHLVGCRVGRPRTGFLAALVLATCIHFTWLARVGRIDMPLTLALTVALGSWHIAVNSPASRWWSLLAYTSLGLGVLLKGPIAVVLVGVVAVPWMLARRSEFHHHAAALKTLWWGVPWTLLIAAPWFIAANLETGGRLYDVFFWYHNIERGLGSETLKANPWWFYVPTAAVDLLPWSLALPVCAWISLRRQSLRTDREATLGTCWFVAIFVFLTCMSFKRADYLLPAYPGFALMAGSILERLTIGRRLVAALAIAMTIAWGCYATCIVPAQEADWPYQRIAQEIRSETDRPVVFFRAESHLLAFHVGRPLSTILEWENLRWWVDRPFPVLVIMPEQEAGDWPNHLPAGRLEEVLRTRERMPTHREHHVVLLRSRPG